MIHLGFAVRIVGKPALRSHDTRRMPSAHLSKSLIYLRDILAYLRHIRVQFYRLAATLLPFETPAQALRQLDECHNELYVLARQIQDQAVRLTTHLDHTTLLSHADEALTQQSIAIIEAQAALLEHLGMQREGSIVIHLGGNTPEAIQRFITRYHLLSPAAQTRLTLEHDDSGASLATLLQLHQQCGIPIIFDYLHYQLNNPEHLPLDIALGLALSTWQSGVRPKVHISSARSEAHLIPARNGDYARVLPPRPGQHADFVMASDLIALLHAARGLPPFDIMIEAKAGDLALLRVRKEVAQLAPELAMVLG